MEDNERKNLEEKIEVLQKTVDAYETEYGFEEAKGKPILLVKLGSQERGWVPNSKHFASMRKQLKVLNVDKRFNIVLFHFGAQMEVHRA